MTAIRKIALCLSILILCAKAVSEDISPSAILKNVAIAYKTIKTYKSEGMITADIDTDEMKMKTETSFSIVLKKPNLYLISWTQKNMSMPGMVQKGTTLKKSLFGALLPGGEGNG